MNYQDTNNYQQAHTGRSSTGSQSNGYYDPRDGWIGSTGGQGGATGRQQTNFTPTNYRYIDTSHEDFATDTLAQITREEYQDYITRFQPVERELLNLSHGRQLLDEQLGRITTNINQAYNSPLANSGLLQQQRYGVQHTAQEVQHNQRQTDLDRAKATAHAQNNTRIAHDDHQRRMIEGGNSVRTNTMDMVTGR